MMSDDLPGTLERRVISGFSLRLKANERIGTP